MSRTARKGRTAATGPGREEGGVEKRGTQEDAGARPRQRRRADRGVGRSPRPAHRQALGFCARRPPSPGTGSAWPTRTWDEAPGACAESAGRTLGPRGQAGLGSGRKGPHSAQHGAVARPGPAALPSEARNQGGRKQPWDDQPHQSDPHKRGREGEGGREGALQNPGPALPGPARPPRTQGARPELGPAPGERGTGRPCDVRTCEVDMREVSCRPVRSDEEMLTGAPRCSLMLTFRSLSTPDTGRGDVLAAGAGDGDSEAGSAAALPRGRGRGGAGHQAQRGRGFLDAHRLGAPTLCCLYPTAWPAPEGRAREAPSSSRHELRGRAPELRSGAGH